MFKSDNKKAIKKGTDAKNRANKIRVITLRRAIEKSSFLLSQYWEEEKQILFSLTV